MKKELIVTIAFFTALSLYGQSTGVVSLDEAIKQAGEYNVQTLPGNSIVAIINIGAVNPSISEYIIQKLMDLLVNNSSLRIVERNLSNLELIEQELNYQMSGEVSAETFQGIGEKLGAETIITGNFKLLGSQNQYQLEIIAISVRTGERLGSKIIPVKRDRALRVLLNDHRLYLGAKAGLSLGFYDDGEGILDTSIDPSISLTGIAAFNAGLLVSVSIWKLVAIQTEVIFTNDTFDFNHGNSTLYTVSYNSLMIPVLVKLVYRPLIFTVQGYAGPYLSLPLGQMEVKHPGGSYSADFSLMSGICFHA